MMFERVPLELRTYKQWVVWRSEATTGPKPTKVPYNARSGGPASVVNADTWSTFDQAVYAYTAGGYSGIGFVLTPHDPFAFIDLDDCQGDQLAFDRQRLIYDTFNSYSELSPSGNGLHIIVKGHVPSGRKRAFVEIYAAARYMTVTGNVVNDAPIEERQFYTETLWNELGKGPEAYSAEGDLVQRESDEVIYNRALSARNGEKFLKLWNGDWPNTINEHTGLLYPSQSEADQALINILVYHTQNRNQVRNMFWRSALGQRPKAKRLDYVEKMINKAFDRTVPAVDFDALKNSIEQQLAEKEAARTQPPAAEGIRAAEAAVQAAVPFVSQPLPPVNLPAHVPLSRAVNTAPTLPPGLVGELAQFFYAAAPRPVPDMALMGALGFMAGICGQSFNVSNTGLNLYMIMLAKSGRGKEAMSSGIDKIVESLRDRIPAISSFIGPGDIASGQALVRYMSNTSSSFVSIIGEFDKLLSAMSSHRANGAMIMLRKMVLDLFGKSGHGQTFRPMVYSDSAKNTTAIASPSFSILGECTPERFFELLDENLINEGLLPRFLILEYLGERPPRNRNLGKVVPSASLLKQLESVIGTAFRLRAGVNGKPMVHDVALAPDAEALMDEFDTYCDDQINSAMRDAVAQLWNRAHLKVLKVAALIAVGVNPHHPEITKDIAVWALNFIRRDVFNMLSHFEGGDIGNDEVKQLIEVRKLIAEYVTEPYEKFGRYDVPRNLHFAKIIPQRFLTQKLASVACFRKDRIGSTNALKRSVSILLDQGEIIEINRDQLQKEFGTSGKSYMVKEMRV